MENLMAMDKAMHGHDFNNRNTTNEAINNIYSKIRDDCSYMIRVNTNCNHYGTQEGFGKNGYTTDGYIGCIVIYNQDIDIRE